jgi:DNA-binding transcriptional LysR family regulator
MDIWQLHIFCKVVEQRSFSKAADSVHLSQPTVSSHIKELERHLDCRLIDRLSRKALPTKEGELLYRYALKLIALRDEAEAALNRFKGIVEGSLFVGGSTIPGGYILPRLISGFLRRFPDVYPAMRVADTGTIIGALLNGEIEIGVVGARAANNQLHQQVLLGDDMRLIVAADHGLARRQRVNLEALAAERFIMRESGSGTLKSIEKNLQERGLKITDLNVVAELGSTEAVIQGVKSGIGISIVSLIAVADDVKAGTLRALKIEGSDLKRNFFLTRHRYRSLSPPAQAFCDYLAAECAGGPVHSILPLENVSS